MRLRFSHLFTVVIAIFAFMPILAVDYLLDGYVRVRETAKLQAGVDAITQDAQTTVQNAIQSLRRISAESPSLCAATFMSNVYGELQRSLYLKQIVVENRGGIQFCSAFEGEVGYRSLSESLTIPGHTETLSAVLLDGFDTPMLKISQAFGPDRVVSAFIVATPMIARGIWPGFEQASLLRVSLTNGVTVFALGPAADAPEGAASGEEIGARSFAGEIPLRAEVAVPFAAVRADYVDLDVGFTIVAALMGCVLLVLTLRYVRKTQLPAFDIERAIAAGEMKPFYQPVINLKTGKLTGCEVLIRWIRRNGEVVPPGAFIDYAEMTGLAIPMTLNLMEQVRQDLEALCREVPDFKVSINLFEGHFRDGTVVQDIQSIFDGSGISYRQLVFEITERRPLDDREAVNRVISGMHALGVRIAMDDAGTGHSNLAYLQTLGIDIIKIDKIFVDMIKQANAPVPVIDGLIAMAKNLDIDIVAEGVETLEQAVYLRGKGVYSAQGYLFAPAMPLASFLTLAYALKPGGRASNIADLAA